MKTNDQNKTALQLGHRDTSLLFNHYRALATHEDAERFWNIRPEIQDNVIAASCGPIDILRGKLAFFGASKFDPKPDLAKYAGVGLDAKREIMIVTEYNGHTQGFLVEAVERIVNISVEDVKPPPKVTGEDSYLTAVTRYNGDLIQIIDVEKVLAEVKDSGSEFIDLWPMGHANQREQVEIGSRARPKPLEGADLHHGTLVLSEAEEGPDLVIGVV